MGTDDFYRLFEGFIEEKQLDPITAKWLLERILSILFTESQKTFKVEGLKEPIEVDAFSEDIFNTKNGVVLEYSGTSPYAELKIQNKCTGEPNSMITYRADKEFDIKNGDQIKITAELPKDAADNGYILKETEKTITVEGLNSYVENLSQINEEDRTELISKLEKAFSAETEKGEI